MKIDHGLNDTEILEYLEFHFSTTKGIEWEKFMDDVTVLGFRGAVNLRHFNLDISEVVG